jgi:hypothetical protein
MGRVWDRVGSRRLSATVGAGTWDPCMCLPLFATGSLLYVWWQVEVITPMPFLLKSSQGIVLQSMASLMAAPPIRLFRPRPHGEHISAQYWDARGWLSGHHLSKARMACSPPLGCHSCGVFVASCHDAGIARLVYIVFAKDAAFLSS